MLCARILLSFVVRGLGIPDLKQDMFLRIQLVLQIFFRIARLQLLRKVAGMVPHIELSGTLPASDLMVPLPRLLVSWQVVPPAEHESLVLLGSPE